MSLHASTRDRPCPGASGRPQAGPEGKRGTEDHGKRAGASAPSRITSSNVETTARANASTATPPISRPSSLAAPSCRRARAPAHCHCSDDGIPPRPGSVPVASPARGPPRQPVRLQQFMHFEVETPVEQERGLPEGHLERRVGRVQRAPREESTRPRPPAPRAPRRAALRSRRRRASRARAAPRGRERPRGRAPRAGFAAGRRELSREALDAGARDEVVQGPLVAPKPGHQVADTKDGRRQQTRELAKHGAAERERTSVREPPR